MRELKTGNIPLIHIIGLPGAGKTTLARRLAKKWKVPVYRIGEYRKRFPSTKFGEADAWLALFKDVSKRKWHDCIVETTGLNCREAFLNRAIPFPEKITVKLVAKRNVLYERIGRKKKQEQGGDWLFSDAFEDKFEFVKKMFTLFKTVPGDITVDTSGVTTSEVYRVVAAKLERYISLTF